VRHRFYVPAALPIGETVEITGEELHHAVRVVRVQENEEIEVFDGRGSAGESENLQHRTAKRWVPVGMAPDSHPPGPACGLRPHSVSSQLPRSAGQVPLSAGQVPLSAGGAKTPNRLPARSARWANVRPTSLLVAGTSTVPPAASARAQVRATSATCT